MTSEPAISSSVPVPRPDPVDWAHLEKASFGDRALVRELLSLFVSQTAQLASTLSGDPADASVSAHKLKGSALAIGAWPVAEAAECLDTALTGNYEAAAEAADALAQRMNEASAAIARYLSNTQDQAKANAGVRQGEPL